MTDERQQLFTRAKEIGAAGPTDDPPNSVVIDATLTHLIKSEQNLDDAIEIMDAATVKQFNISIMS